jgi:hypothetical protein
MGKWTEIDILIIGLAALGFWWLGVGIFLILI